MKYLIKSGVLLCGVLVFLAGCGKETEKVSDLTQPEPEITEQPDPYDATNKTYDELLVLYDNMLNDYSDKTPVDDTKDTEAAPPEIEVPLGDLDDPKNLIPPEEPLEDKSYGVIGQTTPEAPTKQQSGLWVTKPITPDYETGTTNTVATKPQVPSPTDKPSVDNKPDKPTVSDKPDNTVVTKPTAPKDTTKEQLVTKIYNSIEASGYKLDTRNYTDKQTLSIFIGWVAEEVIDMADSDLPHYTKMLNGTTAEKAKASKDVGASLQRSVMLGEDTQDILKYASMLEKDQLTTTTVVSLTKLWEGFVAWKGLQFTLASMGENELTEKGTHLLELYKVLVEKNAALVKSTGL